MKKLFAIALFASSAISPVFTASALAAPVRHDVYVGRQDVGTDPDPNVRFDLEREYNSRHGGY
jgi:hypothetical protein